MLELLAPLGRCCVFRSGVDVKFHVGRVGAEPKTSNRLASTCSRCPARRRSPPWPRPCGFLGSAIPLLPCLHFKAATLVGAVVVSGKPDLAGHALVPLRALRTIAGLICILGDVPACGAFCNNVESATKPQGSSRVWKARMVLPGRLNQGAPSKSVGAAEFALLSLVARLDVPHHKFAVPRCGKDVSHGR